MMDKAYILEHGILELYLLGELNATEQRQVEDILNTDSELKTIFENLEADFQTLAFENAINPPKTVKENLLKSVKNPQPKVVAIQKSKNTKTYLGIAASVAALLLIGTIWLFKELNNTQEALKIAQEEKSLLLKEMEGLSSNYEILSKWAEVINSPDVQQYILTGNDLAPDAKIVSYVNHKAKQVVINAKKLPQLDDQHDYQMWADVEGEMINMGVIHKNTTLLAMNYIENAESFNITIEPAGGNDHPTVSRLISNIYL
ncbi:anti-sigma factor domain-containing protein [Psychroserpens sp. BH13MA-6]